MLTVMMMASIVKNLFSWDEIGFSLHPLDLETKIKQKDKPTYFFQYIS